jgi:hypothetical protein
MRAKKMNPNRPDSLRPQSDINSFRGTKIYQRVHSIRLRRLQSKHLTSTKDKECRSNEQTDSTRLDSTQSDYTYNGSIIESGLLMQRHHSFVIDIFASLIRVTKFTLRMDDVVELRGSATFKGMYYAVFQTIHCVRRPSEPAK